MDKVKFVRDFIPLGAVKNRIVWNTDLHIAYSAVSHCQYVVHL